MANNIEMLAVAGNFKFFKKNESYDAFLMQSVTCVKIKLTQYVG